MIALGRSEQRVADALAARGHAVDVRRMPDSTRTAQEAAAAIGVAQAQIVKSLVFRGAGSGRPLLVLVGGDDRVDLARLEAEVGEAPQRADADWVRSVTGFAIGGIPPLGHVEPLDTLVDDGLLAHEEVWAAAGTPHAVFATSGPGLPALVSGRIVSVAARRA